MVSSDALPAAVPETASFREFADIARVKPSYVTELRKADRLVLTDDAKRVRVAESLQRIKDTSDPTRIGVARRHAEARTEATAGEVQPSAPGDEESPADDEKSSSFQHWRERGERAKALAAERENDIADRKLLRAEEIEPAVSSAFTTIRARIESLPDILSDEFSVMTDATKIRARMRDEIERILRDASEALAVGLAGDAA